MAIIQINNNNRYFQEIINIYYQWWGNIKKLSYEEILSRYTNTLNTQTLPKLYALIINDTLIGTYSLEEKDDIDNESYTPYLANVYIKEKYRHQGYSKLLIQDAKNKSISLGYDTLFLHSHHLNYYEKYSFTFIKEVSTKYGNKRIYSCSLKKKS